MVKRRISKLIIKTKTKIASKNSNFAKFQLRCNFFSKTFYYQCNSFQSVGPKSVGPARPAAGQYLWQARNSACSIFYPVGIWPLMILLDVQVYHHDKKTPIHLLIAGFVIRTYRFYPLISVLYQFRRSFLVLTFTQCLLSFPVIIIITCWGWIETRRLRIPCNGRRAIDGLTSNQVLINRLPPYQRLHKIWCMTYLRGLMW